MHEGVVQENLKKRHNWEDLDIEFLEYYNDLESAARFNSWFQIEGF